MRALIRRLTQLGILGLIAAIGFSSVWVLWQSSAKTDGDAHRKWVIVLGDRVQPDGQPSVYLRSRLDAALAVLRAGRAQRVLISGHAASPKGDEVTAMRNYLVEHGVAPDLITDDRFGVNTYNTCSRARAVFGISDAIVVTQDFHLRRALALCEVQGIDAVGVEALADAGIYLRVRNWFRELVLSRPKALLDSALNPGPATRER